MSSSITLVDDTSDVANPDNPKEKFGKSKPSVSFIPWFAILQEAVVMALGARKYGAFNWRTKPVKVMTYHDAALRHFALWSAGEEFDPESGVSHLAHVRSCCGIIMDAAAHGAAIDDRTKSLAVIAFIKEQTKALPPKPAPYRDTTVYARDAIDAG